jgi:hypothetical protein
MESKWLSITTAMARSYRFCFTCAPPKTRHAANPPKYFLPFVIYSCVTVVVYVCVYISVLHQWLLRYTLVCYSGSQPL